MNYPLQILIVIDYQDHKRLNYRLKSNNFFIYHYFFINYKDLYKKISRIQQILNNKKIDLILFSRNEEVGNKIPLGIFTKMLKIGYSAFSSIDINKYFQQQLIYNELNNTNIEKNIKYYNNEIKKINFLKTQTLTSTELPAFSLIFDVEQLGGARFGLPRISALLKKYQIKATFFITNFVKVVYPKYIVDLLRDGHEIGLHGNYHEFLSSFPKDQQAKLLADMLNDFKLPISSVNFLGRMNFDTVDLLIDCGIKNIVVSNINYYKFFSYPETDVKGVVYQKDSGKNITFIPLTTETYNIPFFSVKHMIQSVLQYSSRQNLHLTILGHPFHDGNNRNFKKIETLIKYLKHRLNFQSLPLREIKINRPVATSLKSNIFSNSTSKIFYLPRSVNDIADACFYLPNKLKKKIKYYILKIK